MSVSSRSWRRSAAVMTAAAAGLIGVGLTATPASAHTPKWTVDCSEVSVDLTAYNDKVTNTVTITVDGKDLLPAETFGREFHKKLEIPTHSSEAQVRLVVKAGDGDKFSRDETKVSPVCEDTPTPSATPPSPSETPSETPSEPSEETPEASDTPSAEAPAPSTSAPGDLAETGASSNTPLIAGAAAVVALAGGGILFATRKRRSARS
ncbi:LAETG motif-containing sortase-dependent surface protein [Streptomyces sp. NPDC048639]|uniref:LAETG motif-containing sortase-dependent surface protein n=1 Tax=Streptomyces sp. NPDC048639 TaxID=3365581 RepID=UPI003715590F